jgi:hypothetical protein
MVCIDTKIDIKVDTKFCIHVNRIAPMVVGLGRIGGE